MIKLIPKELNGGYVIQRGDTFGGIALKHGLSVEQLKQLNPSITNPDKIREGTSLNVSKPISNNIKKNTLSLTAPAYPGIAKKKYNLKDFLTFDRAYNVWAAKNPTVTLNGVAVKTSDLKNYIYDLALYESTFINDNIPTKGSKYRGYFQIENTSGKLPFDDLISHMNTKLSRLTKDDILRARQKGLSDAAILAKIHNQGDYFVNWLWSGVDHADGAGTLVSLYGNDWGTKLNILDRVVTNKALKPGQYIIAKPKDAFLTYAPYVRYPGMDMANIAGLMRAEFKRHYPKRKEPWVGDTLFIPQVRKNGGKLKLIARQ